MTLPLRLKSVSTGTEKRVENKPKFVLLEEYGLYVPIPIESKNAPEETTWRVNSVEGGVRLHRGRTLDSSRERRGVNQESVIVSAIVKPNGDEFDLVSVGYHFVRGVYTSNDSGSNTGMQIHADGAFTQAQIDAAANVASDGYTLKRTLDLNIKIGANGIEVVRDSKTELPPPGVEVLQLVNKILSIRVDNPTAWRIPEFF